MMDQEKISTALEVTFGKGADFGDDSDRLLGMIERGESRMALIQELGNIQSRATGMVIHADCERLANALIDAK